MDIIFEALENTVKQKKGCLLAPGNKTCAIMVMVVLPAPAGAVMHPSSPLVSQESSTTTAIKRVAKLVLRKDY